MSKTVNFRDRQELISADLCNVGLFAKNALDHVVKDAVDHLNGWTEFQVIESSTAEVTVKSGRLYFAGAVYVSEADTVFELINDLPTVNQKWCAIVGYGTEQDVDVHERDFLIDATTGTTEPQAVAMQKLRKAQIATVIGVEAPQPVKPTVSSGNVIIAWVLLDSTGVASIALVEANRTPQTRLNALAIALLDAWRETIGPQLDALRSLIASLQAQISQTGYQNDITDLFVDVARVKEALELEDGYSDYDADRFLDEDESDTANVNYLAKVQEGVRFSDAAANAVNLEVFNPLNPDVVVSNNMLLPKFVEEQRLKVYPYSEALSIAQYTYQAHNMVQRTVARTRIRYGEEKTYCTNSQWWRSGRYDPVQNIFYKSGDTWEVIAGDTSQNHRQLRVRRFWTDTYEEYYWDRITIDHVINGQQIAQTFLQGSDGWMTSVGLYFTAKGGTGNVDIALAEVKYGAPDVQNLIGKTTLDVNDILTSADGTIETKVSFPATFLEAGKRYAIVLTTGGNHYVAMAQGTEYAQGTFFYSVDGAYQMGTFDKDLMFALYFAKFNKVRTVVDLEAMSLSGGITDIDILAPMVMPESCTITFEVQVAGVWYPLDVVQSGNTVLYGLPPLLPFRAVFNGTSDVQAGINMLDSIVKYSRPRTTYKHISTEYTLASATQSFKIVAIIENYYETNHDFDCAILIDGAGAEVAAASVVDEPMDDPIDARTVNHKRVKRTFTWTATEITAPMTSVKIVSNATTTSALDTFHLAERIHLAF